MARHIASDVRPKPAPTMCRARPALSQVACGTIQARSDTETARAPVRWGAGEGETMSEQNGITREIASNGASRWAHFKVNGCIIAATAQRADAVSLTMESPIVSWTGSGSFGVNQIVHAESQAEALRQAIELAREWEQDAGKPMKEVLKGVGNA